MIDTETNVTSIVRITILRSSDGIYKKNLLASARLQRVEPRYIGSVTAGCAFGMDKVYYIYI